jgi:hypothetical protein
MSTVAIVLLGLVGACIAVWPLADFYVVRNDLPRNPLQWKAERRAQRDRTTAYRIGRLEHELGYAPCSNEACWECNSSQGINRLWVYGGSRLMADPRLNKDVSR